MSRKTPALLIFLAVFCGFAAAGVQAATGGLGALRPETRKALSGFDCAMIRHGTGAARQGPEALCVGGNWKTVRLRIGDGEPVGRRPARLQLEWREWHDPSRAGRKVPQAADRAVAEAFVRTLAERFLPGHAGRLTALFFSQNSESMTLNGYRVAYSYKPGPRLNRRVIELVDTQGLKRTRLERPEARDLTDLCRQAAARAIGATDGNLRVLGAPREGFDVRTVVLAGGGGDQLHCQVHEGGFYQLRRVAGVGGSVRILGQGLLR